MFTARIVTKTKAESSDEPKERKVRDKSHYLIPDYIIQEIVDNKIENGINNSQILNRSIVSVIKLHANPPAIFSELTHLREYLIQWKKVRLFYMSEYQIIIKFKGKIRIIEIYHNADLIVDGEVDITV